MEERREENFDKEFDEDEFDPTKEAFFSDMIEMEEEIASEAYELVEHAINLIESQYYNDSIEILRQAIGLYTQINREEEIKAINDKIAEIYVLKEKAFREVEIESEKAAEPVEVPEVIDKSSIFEKQEVMKEFEATEESKAIEEHKVLKDAIKIADLMINAENLLKEAQELINNNYFEEALSKYDEVETIYTELGKSSEIDNLYKLIEDCYNRKAKFLRSIKKEEIREEIDTSVKVEAQSTEDLLKEKRLKEYFENKKREEEISSKAYQLLDKAAELTTQHKYDKALEFYEKGANLFGELNWTYEVRKVQDTIFQLKIEKARYIQRLEEERMKPEKVVETKEEITAQQVTEIEEQDRIAQIEKLREIEFQKMEQEFFKAQIDNMATEAARMAREYELAMQKAIKKGELEEECIYPKVIEIYKKIRELLVDKGWNKEATIYDDTIDIYIQKFEQDKRIRQIEAEKIKKQHEAEKMLKLKKEDIEIHLSEEQIKAKEMQQQKEIEIQNVRNQLNDMSKRADRLAREYELALRKGKFELKCPYPQIINIYKKAKYMAQERGWDTDIAIFSSQIFTYKEKLEKDKKLREIEAEKARKQEEVEKAFKVKREEPKVSLDIEKLKLLEEQRKLEEEKEDFEDMVNAMINRAEKIAREYDTDMKKAIKKGRLAQNPPFLKIINIYEKVKQMFLERGRNEEAIAYGNQINFYSQKLEQDNKLREVEAKKAEREKALEEMHKVDRKVEIDDQRLKASEKKKEEEEFEKFISENVNMAEKMVRDFEIAMRKAYRKGEILETTPYSKVIDIYKNLQEKVYARGWREQSEVYINQIKIYQDKLEKHEKLLEVEVQKAQKEKGLEEMHKVEKESEADTKRLSKIERKKEEKEFEKNIAENVSIAEKMVRDHEIAMRKSYREGKILESTPYPKVIEIYKEIREKIYAKGWKEQAKVFANQIKIYQEKLDKHKNLLEIEAQKAQKQKELEEMHKVEKKSEADTKKLSIIEEKKKEEKEFEKHILELVNKAEKLEREFDSSLKKAIKKGKVIELTPYPEIIEIYKQIKDELDEKGWVDQSQIYLNQIKIYQEKLDKHKILLDKESEKAEKVKELEELKKAGKKEVKPFKPERIKELEAEKEEDILLDKAMSLIDETEKEVKSYELSIRKDILMYVSPYEKAIFNYEEARKLFQKIGWIDEANRLIKTIKFYKDKKEKDDKLREIEQKKLEKPEVELEAVKIELDKDFLESQKRLREFEKKEKEADEKAVKVLSLIQNAEKMAQEYELKLKSGIFDYEAPYEKIIEIYRVARKKFEEINWKEESAKLIDTINFYKEKLEQDKKIRALELEKVKKREKELLLQQKLLEQARQEQERLLQKRKESLQVKKERIAQFETEKDKAFRLMDQAKRELRLNNFDEAIDIYKESEKMFIDMKWEEGIMMVRDSITMIINKKKAYELEQKAVEERKVEELEFEEKLEEKLAEAREVRKKQQEEKRREFLKVQREKEREEKISDEAYQLLEEGTNFMDRKKFSEAFEKYMAARDLFEEIGWQREVSRINNELLFKLKREEKQAEILEEIKLKKIEEEKELELIKEETKKEHEEMEKKRKEEKRKLVKEEYDRKIAVQLNKAEKLIESYRYNEGIVIIKEEIQKLNIPEKESEIKELHEKIENLGTLSHIPLITIEISGEEIQNANFKAAYTALDEAQISIINKNYKKAISELNEAKYNLEKVKIGKRFVKEIDEKIDQYREKLGRKPKEPEIEVLTDEETQKIKARIIARRELRRNKVLDLLKKSSK
ncbi:MAG: hypothetical protein ACFE9I_02730 [Candidatus Hermodarchaeota archaeon]